MKSSSWWGLWSLWFWFPSRRPNHPRRCKKKTFSLSLFAIEEAVKCNLQFATIAWLLITTEWGLESDSIVAVNPHATGLNSLGVGQSSVNVMSDDSSSQTVIGCVGTLDGFIQGLEFNDALDWTKNLRAKIKKVWIKIVSFSMTSNQALTSSLAIFMSSVTSAKTVGSIK